MDHNTGKSISRFRAMNILAVDATSKRVLSLSFGVHPLGEHHTISSSSTQSYYYTLCCLHNFSQALHRLLNLLTSVLPLVAHFATQFLQLPANPSLYKSPLSADEFYADGVMDKAMAALHMNEEALTTRLNSSRQSLTL